MKKRIAIFVLVMSSVILVFTGGIAQNPTNLPNNWVLFSDNLAFVIEEKSSGTIYGHFRARVDGLGWVRIEMAPSSDVRLLDRG